MSTLTARSAPRTILGLLAALGLVAGFAMPVAATTNEKVTICHATSSENNPYVALKVPANSGYEPHLSDNEGNSPLAGHEQDFLLENTDLETCDGVPEVDATPLAPSVSDATCEAAGTLTLTAVEGISYSIEPAYTEGDSGDFTVTAISDEGYVIPDEAQTVFEVSVPAALDCPEDAAAIAPSVSPSTCAAAGTLSLTAVTGVTYAVEPAYAAGASGAFKVTASAQEGFELTGQTVFNVNVEAKKVCNEGTQAGNPPASPAAQIPNTAMAAGAVDLAPIVIVLMALAGLAFMARGNIASVMSRR